MHLGTCNLLVVCVHIRVCSVQVVLITVYYVMDLCIDIINIIQFLLKDNAYAMIHTTQIISTNYVNLAIILVKHVLPLLLV